MVKECFVAFSPVKDPDQDSDPSRLAVIIFKSYNGQQYFQNFRIFLLVQQVLIVTHRISFHFISEAAQILNCEIHATVKVVERSHKVVLHAVIKTLMCGKAFRRYRTQMKYLG